MNITLNSFHDFYAWMPLFLPQHNEIDRELNRIDEALTEIDSWGKNIFKLNIENVLKNKTFEGYVSAYQTTTERLDAFSRKAFSYRMRYEKKSQHKKTYLEDLNHLDKALCEYHKRIEGIKTAWLKILTRPQSNYFTLFKDKKQSDLYAQLEQATGCLLTLNKAISQLKGPVDWVEQTCYFTHAHEAQFANEMNARNKKSDQRLYLSKGKKASKSEDGYHLSVARTITDDAVDVLSTALSNTKRLYFILHPDKQPISIQVVASYAASCLNQWRMRAENSQTIYRASQFYTCFETAQATDKTTWKGNPQKPTYTMGLNALLLHQAYLKHFEQSDNLVKKTRDTPELLNDLFVSKNKHDESLRFFVEANKQYRAELIEENHRLKREMNAIS